MPQSEIDAFIKDRKLSVSSASVMDWRRAFRKRGDKAFITRRKAREIDPLEMVRLHDADGGQLALPEPEDSSQEQLGAIASVVRLYRAHKTVAPEAALEMITGILGLTSEQ